MFVLSGFFGFSLVLYFQTFCHKISDLLKRLRHFWMNPQLCHSSLWKNETCDKVSFLGDRVVSKTKREAELPDCSIYKMLLCRFLDFSVFEELLMKFKPNLKLKACEFSFVFCSFVKIKCPQKWVSNSKVQQGKSLNSIRVS